MEFLSLPEDAFESVAQAAGRDAVCKFLSSCRDVFRASHDSQRGVFRHFGCHEVVDLEMLGLRSRGNMTLCVQKEASEKDMATLSWKSEVLIQLHGFFILVPPVGSPFVCITPLDVSGAKSKDMSGLKEMVTLPKVRCLKLRACFKDAFDNVHCPRLESLHGHFTPRFLVRHAATLKSLFSDDPAGDLAGVQADEFPDLEVLQLRGSRVTDRVAAVVRAKFPTTAFACPSGSERLFAQTTPGTLSYRHGLVHGIEGLRNYSNVDCYIRLDEESDFYDPPLLPSTSFIGKAQALSLRRSEIMDVVEITSIDQIAELPETVRVLICEPNPLCAVLNALAQHGKTVTQLHITGVHEKDGRYDEAEHPNAAVATCDGVTPEVRSVLEMLSVIHVDADVCGHVADFLEGEGYFADKERCDYCLPLGRLNAKCLRRFNRRRMELDESPKARIRRALYAQLMSAYYIDRDATSPPGMSVEDAALYAWNMPGSIDPACPHNDFIIHVKPEEQGTVRWWHSECQCRFQWEWTHLEPDGTTWTTGVAKEGK
eukprot:Polyplicarium_translucidae@DN2753_c0_g1_i1.p2